MKLVILSQFSLGILFGVVIACSPTKFNPVTSVNSVCDATVTNCVVEQGFINLTQNFEVGAGKVDILFVNDNSASMSPIQIKLKDRFAGFIQNLESKKIDYRIAVTTTDLAAVQKNRLITLENSKSFISNADSNKLALFNKAIVRTETLRCEDFIIAMFNTFGSSFQTQGVYASQYSTKCPSPDTRGTYTSLLAVSESAETFIRSDANLNVIVISNDEVRQGRFNLANSDPRFLPLEQNDKAESFISLMQQKYPNKYWDYNSIVVKDSVCRDSQVLKNAQGQVVTSQAGGPAIAGGIGAEYAKISNSAALDIDNNPRSRGQILNICEEDYTQHFSNMATKIAEEARMLNLKCKPASAPVVNYLDGSSVPTSLYTWNADKITFRRGSEGAQVAIQYKCYNGPL